MMSDKECPTCGRDDFASRQGMKNHHIRVHNESIAGVEFTCKNCGKQYRKRPSRKKETNFCSNECKYEYFRENNTFKGKNNPSWNGGKVKVSCGYCGKSIKIIPSRLEKNEKNYCSISCMAEDYKSRNSGENCNFWNGGKVRVVCANCGKKIKVKPYKIQRNKKHFCSIKCMGEWNSENRRGESHPRWKGGFNKYQIKRSEAKGSWKRNRKLALKRDDDTCQLCGYAMKEKFIDVHHIKAIMEGGTNELHNLVTLCRSCHSKMENKSVDEQKELLNKDRLQLALC